MTDKNFPTFRKQIKDMIGVELPKNVPYSESVDDTKDLYSHAKYRGKLGNMEPVFKGFVAYSQGNLETATYITPLAFNVYHDGNWNEPPLIFIHNLDDKNRQLDLFNEANGKGLFEGIANTLVDYMDGKHPKPEYGVLAKGLAIDVVKLGTSYIASGHALNWCIFSRPEDFIGSCTYIAIKGISHAEDIAEVSHAKNHLKGIFKSVVQQQRNESARNAFMKAKGNTILVADGCQSLTCTIAVGGKSTHFKVINHLFETEALEIGFGFDAMKEKNEPSPERDKFIDYCRQKEQANNGIPGNSL
jgi:hypothetical protein